LRAKLSLPDEVVIPPEIMAMTPLEVMLRAMRQRYGEGDILGALTAAGMAAPYVHARLSASDIRVHHNNPANRSDTEIAMEIEGLRKRIEAARAVEAVPLIEAQVVPEPVEVVEADQRAGKKPDPA
jgi:hypothetical protein